jgi:8-oxo-dGTP pyrophosphatase MutT (NUDIX family)
LLRRAYDPEHTVQNKWDVPGGRINPGTPLMENLAREVSEETGLVMTATPVIVAAQDLLPKQLAHRHVVRITYLGAADGDVRLSEEHIEYRWFDFSEITALPNLDSYFKKLIDDGVISEAVLQHMS